MHNGEANILRRRIQSSLRPGKPKYAPQYPNQAVFHVRQLHTGGCAIAIQHHQSMGKVAVGIEIISSTEYCIGETGIHSAGALSE